MIGKKINQLATELAPVSTDLTIIGDPDSGVSKKITLAQLGAIFSGAVSFYTNLASFPATGDINVIYCAKDTQKLYLWSGSAYVEVFPSQALLNTYQLRSEKGVSNGYASLDSAGKVPIAQLPSSIMEYKGTWNASTNTPTLANGTGDTGDVYICNVAGTVNFGAGPLTFAVGDYVIYSGSIWQRSSGAVGTVTSVAASITGNSIGITGSPITTSGTLALAFAGTSAQYVNGAGNLITFPSIISQAQNLVTEVYNKTGATLTKGTVVYIDGGQGNLPSVTKALATGDATSAQTYGIVQADITNMNNGYVVAAGRLGDLDTQAFTEGTQLYLSATTAGTYTSTKQYAPNHLVYVAIVVRAHPTQGVIEVKIQNGYEMDELHNVAAQSPSNGDILQYVTSTSLWTKTAGTTTNIAEGTNLYYTEARVNANTNVAANTAARHNAVTIGTANGLSLSTQVLSLALASGSTTGALSSTDWTTFNSKQNALTNPVTGTGASGQVTYFNGTTSVTGNNNFFWDTTNNRLGIGTTTPQRSIEIFNSTADNHLRLSGNAPSVSMGEAVTGSIYQAKFGLVTVNGQFVTAGVAGDFVIISQTGATIIGTSSTEKMRVQSSGNVSINNTNDTYKLDVTGTGRFTGQLRLESTITDGTYTYTLPSATGTLALTSALSGMITGSGTTNYLPKFTGTSTIGDSLVSQSGSNINIAGDLYVIKNESGAYRNLVIENSNAGGYARTVYQVGSGGASGIAGVNYAPSIFFKIGMQVNDTNTPIVFVTNNDTERMRLNASGNLSIGNTNDSYKLDVSGTGRFIGLAQDAIQTIFTLYGYNAANQAKALYFTLTGSTPVWTLTTGAVGTDAGINILPNGNAGLSIAYTGAATFSSSVTATQGIFRNSGVPAIQAIRDLNVVSVGTAGQGIEFGALNGSTPTAGAAIYGTLDNPATTGALIFQTLNAGSLGTRMYITNTGNVGIGTTSPSAKLNVSGDIHIGDYGTAALRILDFRSSNSVLSIQTDGTSGALGTNIIYSWANGGQGPLRFSNASGEVMRLAGNGNVGIGTTSPQRILTVYNSNAATLYQTPTSGTGASDGFYVGQTSDVSYVWNYNSFPLVFATANTERMRITSGGNVRINSTTDINSRGVSLQVSGVETAQLYGYGNGYGIGLFMCPNSAATGTHTAIAFRSPANGDVGTITTTSSSTSYNTTSDYRLKTDYKDFSGLDLVSKIKAYDYEWKADKTRSYGVIAHELQSVINYAVTGVKDGKDMQGVDYSKIVPVLIKAIQEQQQQIEQLKNK